MNYNRQLQRWTVLGILFLLLLSACSEATTTQESVPSTSSPPPTRDGNSLVLVTDNHWNGNFMPTYVLKLLLEERMGYSVEVIERGSIPATMAAVSSGQADAFPGGWFPTHTFNFDKHANLIHLGQTYGGETQDAFEGWMVSSDLAQQYGVSEVADLLDPTLAETLDYDGDGKGDIVGCPDFWACAQRNQAILEDYGLGQLYELIVPSSEPEMLDAIDERYNNGHPALFYLYVPIAYPEDGNLSDRAVWLEGTQSYLPMAVARTVSRTDFIATHPDVAMLLNSINLPGEDISQGMVKIAKEGRTPEVVTEWAREWIDQHADEVESWIPSQEPQATPEFTYPPNLPEDTLVVAYSTDKEDLFLKLVAAYNLNRPADTPPVHPIPVSMTDMLSDAVNQQFAAISPDSSVWLEQMDRMWQQRNPEASPLTGNIARYAISPLVIAMWESDAQELGYPEDSVGWIDLMNTVQEDPSFRWNHPDTSTAAGLLTVTAEFYSAADKFENLSLEDLEAQDTLDYVTNIESSISRYGGESEERVILRILADGGYPLDAFVTQEQKIIYFNQNTPSEKLAAIYPKEGTFWMDHPLVLLDGDWVTAGQRRVFRDFADFVADPAQQQLVLEEGYRPAEVSISLDQPGSLIDETYNVNPEKPETLLQVPSPGVLEGIREVWRLTKKPANIYLVVDTSGSMEGEKLSSAKGALLSFMEQVEGEQDQVAMLEFNDSIRIASPLGPLNSDRMSQEIRGLTAGGGTLLYDAVAYALSELEEKGSSDRINVIVAMTDGRSDGQLSVLEDQLKETEIPIMIFTVGYGSDADLDVLQRIAQLGEGEAYPSDPETINQLYELLSAYF